MENASIFKEEKDLYTIIGKNIRYYRKLYSLNKKEMTQEALAELANVSTSLIGNLESKKTTQTDKTIDSNLFTVLTPNNFS